jgi:hypothetical protein
MFSFFMKRKAVYPKGSRVERLDGRAGTDDGPPTVLDRIGVAIPLRSADELGWPSSVRLE